jgi:nitroreductase
MHSPADKPTGDALEFIESRHSIRKFTDEPVSDEQIRKLLTAAMAAPSANNRQPWEFVVVRDRAARAELAQVHRYSGMAAQAPVVFVVCGRESVSRHWAVDCSAATENLLLEAVSLGLGAVWVGIYTTPEHEATVRGLLGIPDDLRVLCLVPLGHPAETRVGTTRFDPARAHFERFGQFGQFGQNESAGEK